MGAGNIFSRSKYEKSLITVSKIVDPRSDSRLPINFDQINNKPEFELIDKYNKIFL